jgi:hypothetical protein
VILISVFKFDVYWGKIMSLMCNKEKGFKTLATCASVIKLFAAVVYIHATIILGNKILFLWNGSKLFFFCFITLATGATGEQYNKLLQ